MTTPNQITVCASASRQGVYVPEVRIYAAEPHPAHGLLPTSFYFRFRTRTRAKALAFAKEHADVMRTMSPDAARAYGLEHGRAWRECL